MKLFSVCAPCDLQKPYDGNRQWGDFDNCSKCGEIMDVWTESGIRNAEARGDISRTRGTTNSDAVIGDKRGER